MNYNKKGIKKQQKNEQKDTQKDTNKKKIINNKIVRGDHLKKKYMGTYSNNSDILCIDKFLPNDGRLNCISATQNYDKFLEDRLSVDRANDDEDNAKNDDGIVGG